MKSEAKLLTFLCIATIAGLAGLYMVAADMETADMPLSELSPSMAGQRVSTRGVLTEVRGSGSGAWVTLGSPDTANELDVRVDAVADGSLLVPGSVWEVEGELVIDDSQYVMFLGDMSSMILIEPAASRDIPLETLCTSPRFYDGLRVRVVGDISKTYAWGNTTTAYIESSSGAGTWSMKCVAYENATIPVGVQVAVEGTFGYDPSRSCYRLVLGNVTSA